MRHNSINLSRMMRQILYAVAVIVLVTLRPAAGSDYLAEKQAAYMEPCHLEQAATLNECLRKALGHIYSTWANGIPSLDDSPPIDPLFIKQMDFVEDGSGGASNLPSLSVKMYNLTVSGMRTAKVKMASFKKSPNSPDNEYRLKLEIAQQRTKMSATYAAVGSIMVLQINSRGKSFFEIGNSSILVTARLRPVARDNVTFFNVTSLQVAVNRLEQVRMHFENLFHNEMLNESTNELFNQNWRMFFEIFQPKIEQIIGDVLLEHFNGVFERVPAAYFVADLPQAVKGEA